MLKKSVFIFSFFLIGFYCGTGSTNRIELQKDVSYPRWLSSATFSSDQTSGITFIKETAAGDKYFLLADDTGGILHLKISRDTVFSITPAIFSQRFQSYIDTFPKADFEEIVYDKKNNQVYLSIEGNGNYPEKYAGIYQVYFKDNDVLSDTLTDIKKINITPKDVFEKYIRNNIGYEGLALDDNYFYLGLEGFSRNNIFADSTVLFIADRKTSKIIKQINTKSLGIHTICGLFSDKNYSVYGVDRNNKSLFHITFNRELNIKDTSKVKIETNIPSYSSFDYVASIESITMDSQNNIFLVDDPWKTFFIPSTEILNQLDSLTVNHFRNFVPVIYKYLLAK